MKIKQVKEILSAHPEHWFYVWVGGIHTEEDLFVRADCMDCYVIGQQDDKFLIRKLKGVKDQHDDGLVMEYSSKPVSVVLDGRRKGRLLRPESLWAGEGAKPLVLDWTLEEFFKNHPGLSEGLCGFLDKAHKSAYMMYPAPYLACSEDSSDIQLRNRPETYKWISEWPHYSTELSPEANFKNLRDRGVLGVNAGAGRRAYPFEHVVGRGVVVFDPSNCRKWQCIPKVSAVFDSGFLRIDFRRI